MKQGPSRASPSPKVEKVKPVPRYEKSKPVPQYEKEKPVALVPINPLTKTNAPLMTLSAIIPTAKPTKNVILSKIKKQTVNSTVNTHEETKDTKRSLSET